MKQEILKLEHIFFGYDEDQATLKDVSLAIHSGDRIAVIGNNGAGKSTFFLCCNGVLKPQSGKLYLHGEEIPSKQKELNRMRQHVGIVFQDPNQQLIGATVEEEISFGPMNLRLGRDEVARRVDETIEMMELEALRERPPHYLSGGEKKRLTIADVLAMRPELILLDEPTAFLDIKNSDMLEDILHDLYSQGKTLMIATHDLDFAYRWATRVLIFSAGRLVADGAPKDLFKNTPLLTECHIHQPKILKLTQALIERGVLSGSVEPPTDIDALTALLLSAASRKAN